MKTKPRQGAALWQEQPKPAPALSPGSEPKPAPALSPEAQQLLTELAASGVLYDPLAPCEHCGCPLRYPLTLYPECFLCCMCYPGGRTYGHVRHAQLVALFPRRRWRR